ncbi:Pentatricopeptide repeat-containing protein At1g26900, mitochondrial [Linum grandiflorum]
MAASFLYMAMGLFKEIFRRGESLGEATLLTVLSKDSLGGLLKEARGLIESLPVKSDATAWRALLATCRVHGDVELGEMVKRVLVEMGEEHPTDSMLVASTYAVAGRLGGRRSLQESGVEHKEVGCSIIDGGE